MFICIYVFMNLFLLGHLGQVMVVDESWFLNILPGKMKVKKKQKQKLCGA